MNKYLEKIAFSVNPKYVWPASAGTGAVAGGVLAGVDGYKNVDKINKERRRMGYDPVSRTQSTLVNGTAGAISGAVIGSVLAPADLKIFICHVGGIMDIPAVDVVPTQVQTPFTTYIKP